MTFGWLIGEVVRPKDQKRRPFGRLVKEEIATPLGATDLWLGIDDAVEPRMPRLDDTEIDLPDDRFAREAQPEIIDLLPDTFERPYVRRACIPAVGGILGAHSGAPLRDAGQWRAAERGAPAFGRAGGQLRSRGRISRIPIRSSLVWWRRSPGRASGWAGTAAPPTCAPRNMRVLSHPGMGGNIGWADSDLKLAVAFCHNLMVDMADMADDSRTIIGAIIRAAL